MSGPSLQLLGPPLLIAGGKPATHLRRKAAALIAYLAVDHQPHSRDALATLLWPDFGQSRARANLRLSLHALKEVLGKGILTRAQDTVMLEMGRIIVDVESFQRLASGCGRHEGNRVCDECLMLLERAQRIYRDDFLFGFTLPDCTDFDHWQLLHADRLRGELADVLRRLVQGYEVESRVEQAFEHAQRLLALDPLEETSQRLVIRLHAKSGRRVAALRQFDDCRRILRDELDEEPDEETLSLVTEIRHGRLGSPPSGRTTTVAKLPDKRRPAASRTRVEPTETNGESALRREVVLLAASAPLRRDGSFLECTIDFATGEHVAVVGLPSAAFYPTVTEAVDAALLAQEASGGQPCLVIHAGFVERSEAGYQGPLIDHAGALLAASPPGEILLSASAARQADRPQAQPFSLRALGKHRFSDLGYPEDVYQVLPSDDERELPLLQALDTRPNNLPSQPNPFIGGRSELRELTTLLTDERVTLVTLSGPAGVGKTRLALQAAALMIHRFDDGSFFVDLAPIRDHHETVRTIATTLGVRETMGWVRPAGEVLRDYLHRRNLLLVLDNFEHVLPAAGEIMSLCEASPGLKLLVTSRQALGIRGERRYRVSPLRLPEPNAAPLTILQCESVRLCLDRGMAARPDLEITPDAAETIGRVCIRLDGLPLAIELAASNLKVLSPADLERLLPQHLMLLKSEFRGLSERQQTLERAIDWSYDLLDERERRLLALLSVFVGGWTLEAAEAVCCPVTGFGGIDVLDGMTSLVEKSLVNCAVRTRGSRFSMLETVREYALRKLGDRPDADSVRYRHAAYFLSIAQEAEPKLHGANQMEWLEHLKEERENLQTALRWHLERRRPFDALRICLALEWFWYRYGHFTDARKWLAEALESTGEKSRSVSEGQGRTAFGEDSVHDRAVIKARALRVSGFFTHLAGEWKRARLLLAESLRLAMELHDTPNEILSLSALGALEHWLGETAAGKEHVAKALQVARERRDPYLILRSLIWAYSMNGGRHLGVSPRERLEEARRLARRLGDVWCEAHASNGLGDLCTQRRRYAEARTEYRIALSGFRKLKDDWLAAWSLDGLGRAALFDGDNEGAAAYTREAIKLFSELGDRPDVVILFRRLATALWHLGDRPAAVCLFAAYENLRKDLPKGAERTARPRIYTTARAAARSVEPQKWAEGGRMSYELALECALSAHALRRRSPTWESGRRSRARGARS